MTLPVVLASIVVCDAPDSLVSVIPLVILIGKNSPDVVLYSPGATSTVSPYAAESSTACFIVGTSVGTCQVLAYILFVVIIPKKDTIIQHEIMPYLMVTSRLIF
jgi:hypothetical protein